MMDDEEITLTVNKADFRFIVVMAGRYAHGRHTFAPSVVRDFVKSVEKQTDMSFCDSVIDAPWDEEMKEVAALREDWLDDVFWNDDCKKKAKNGGK